MKEEQLKELQTLLNGAWVRLVVDHIHSVGLFNKGKYVGGQLQLDNTYWCIGSLKWTLSEAQWADYTTQVPLWQISLVELCLHDFVMVLNTQCLWGSSCLLFIWLGRPSTPLPSLERQSLLDLIGKHTPKQWNASNDLRSFWPSKAFLQVCWLKWVLFQRFSNSWKAGLKWPSQYRVCNWMPDKACLQVVSCFTSRKCGL